MPTKTPLRQLIALLALALGIVALSVVSTLYVLDVPVGDFAGKVGRSLGLRYHHATMTDAQLNCEKRLNTSFKDRISVMHMDSYSSRLSADGELYKIFLEADVYPDSSRVGKPREVFVSCFVFASSGKIERFQYAGDGEPVRGVDGEGTNAFGL